MDVVASDLPTPCPDGELEEGELEDGETSSDDLVDDIAVSAAVPLALASELPGFGRVYQTGLRKGMRVFPIPQRRTLYVLQPMKRAGPRGAWLPKPVSVANLCGASSVCTRFADSVFIFLRALCFRLQVARPNGELEEGALDDGEP